MYGRKSVVGFSIVALAGFALALAFGSPARAEQFEIHFKYAGAYMWRGMDKLPNEEPAFQPSVKADFQNGWSAELFGSYGLDTNKEWDEFDYTLAYKAPLVSRISWTAGFIYYDFQHNIPDSSEAFGGLDFNVPLKPSVRLYGDFDEGQGWYLSTSIHHEIPWGLNPSSAPLKLFATIGLNDGQWGTEAGFQHFDIGASRSFGIDERFTITPSLHYSVTPGDRIPAQDNAFWFSVDVAAGL